MTGRTQRSPGPWRRARAWQLLAAALLLAAPAARQGTAAEAPLPAIPTGQMAPDFALPDPSGKVVRLSDFRGKKAVFVNFWASWCPACQLEMPTLETAYQRFKDRGLEVVAVSIDRGGPRAVARFTREHKISFPVLHDRGQKVMDQYDVNFIPTHFYIDRAGKIRGKEVGPKDWIKPETWQVFEGLLKEQ